MTTTPTPWHVAARERDRRAMHRAVARVRPLPADVPRTRTGDLVVTHAGRVLFVTRDMHRAIWDAPTDARITEVK